MAIQDTADKASAAKALAEHAQGRIGSARGICEAALAVNPDDAECLHLLGVIAAQDGRFEEAAALFARAIAVDGRQPVFHSNLGNALASLGRQEAALQCYASALTLDPVYAEAWFNQGTLLGTMGRHRDAVASYDRSLQALPGQLQVHLNRGMTLQDLGEHDAALTDFTRALAIAPDSAEAHFCKANALAALGRLDEALACYDEVINIDPGHAAGWNNRGSVLGKLELNHAAIVSYDMAIKCRPGYAEAHCNRGLVLQLLGCEQAAVEDFDEALAQEPDSAEFHQYRGHALARLHRSEEALQSYDQALRLAPDKVEILNDRGAMLSAADMPQAALESYDRAIRLQPDYAEAWCNRGVLMLELGRHDEAIDNFDRARALDPDHPAPPWNKAHCLLLKGDFASGLPLYEWRWKSPESAPFHREYPQPLWLGGQAPGGKIILVHCEQGLGDSLQFCRYVPLLARMGARVWLHAPAELRSLMGSLAGTERLLAGGDAVSGFDWHVPLMSLPLALGTRLESIPAEVPYLRVPEPALRQWGARLGQRSRLRIGLAWSGKPTHRNDRRRSMPLAQLLPHLPDDAELFCLQRELRATDRDILERDGRIRFFGTQLEDFTQTAALCSHMDLVISVDTSVAHLAGALGRPVWIMLPFLPDWRWLLGRDDSPWYPSARLYRQARSGDWKDPLSRVARDLARWLRGP